jgi:tubulin epsilon
MRFEGNLNVDINEIAMNLVPFPSMKYVVASLAPLYTNSDVKLARKLDQIFVDSFSRDHQLMSCDIKNSIFMADAMLFRGNVYLSDIRKNIEKYKTILNFRLSSMFTFVPWNPDGWKIGLCNVPSIGQVIISIFYSALLCFESCK